MPPSEIAQRRKAQRNSGAPDYKKRRDEIVKVAAEIFHEKGYEATSIIDIARATGLDRASLYYYSASKTELFQEVVQKAVEQNTMMAERIATSDVPALEKIQVFIFEMMEGFKAQYPYMQIYWQEDMAKIKSPDNKWSVQILKLARRFNDAVISIIQAALDEGAISANGEARLIAYGVIGILNSTHRWFSPTSGFSSQHIAEVFANIVTEGLKPRTPSPGNTKQAKKRLSAPRRRHVDGVPP